MRAPFPVDRRTHHVDHKLPSPQTSHTRPCPGRTRLKWVFAVDDAIDDTYAPMTKVALLSALKYTSLVPVCIFSGAPNRKSRWLEEMGARVVFHTPTWREKLYEGFKKAEELRLNRSSPLYDKFSMMLATWLRLDLGVLGFADEYVLYADVDVLFRQDLGLADFGVTLPQFFHMGTEMWVNNSDCGNGSQCGNAGVMLVNVGGLRRTHSALIAATFSTGLISQGLFFGAFGPGDQGALNRFYAGRFEVSHWPLFNWKPYWGHCAAAKIVHFHGPKPLDYLKPLSQATPLLKGLVAKCQRGGEKIPSASTLMPGLHSAEGAGGCLRLVRAWLQILTAPRSSGRRRTDAHG